MHFAALFSSQIPERFFSARSYAVGRKQSTQGLQSTTRKCHKLSKQFDLRMAIDKHRQLSRLLGALDFTVAGKHHRVLYKAMFCMAFHAFLRIGEMTVQSANATNPNLLQWKQLEIKDTSLTVTFIHFRHNP